MTWEPLAERDPVPGDPGAVVAVAHRLTAVADALGDQAPRLDGAADPGLAWQGLAAERFDRVRTQLPGQLSDAGRRCDLAAAALRVWARELEDAQELARRALERARQAQDDLDAADAGIAAMRTHRERARLESRRWNAANPDGPRREPQPWSGPDWDGRREAALEELRAARAMLEEALAIRDAAAARCRDELTDLGRGPHLAPLMLLRPFLRAVGAGRQRGSVSFVRSEDGRLLLNTAEAWRAEAYRQAGIDPVAWDPDKGLDAIHDEVIAAWEFYGELYERDPDRFLWAGMAKLAGGSFYAGFRELRDIGTAMRRLDGDPRGQAALLVDRLPMEVPAPLHDQIARSLQHGTSAVADDLWFAEVQFLRMQKAIFDDLAWQHLAYEQGGIAAMEDLFDAEEIRDPHIRGWRDIHLGDVAQGNRWLLQHEQYQVIGRMYDVLRDHSAVTWMLTYAMSNLGESPVPGAPPFSDVVNTELLRISLPDRITIWRPPVPLPERLPGLDVEIPFRDGVRFDTGLEGDLVVALRTENVSIAENRWEWIDGYMLPAYLELVDRGEAGDYIGLPVEILAENQGAWPALGRRFRPWAEDAFEGLP